MDARVLQQIKTQKQPQRWLLCTNQINTKKLQALFLEDPSFSLANTLHCADGGGSFKIDFSDTAKKQKEDPQANALGVMHWAALRPQGNGKKLLLIENFDRATTAAQNALLKLIEEPPSYLQLVFTTPNPYSVLTTIRSRMTTMFLGQSPNQATDLSTSEQLQPFFAAQTTFDYHLFFHQAEKSFKKEDKRTKFKALFQALVSEIQQQQKPMPWALPLLHQGLEHLVANGNVRILLAYLAEELPRAKKSVSGL